MTSVALFHNEQARGDVPQQAERGFDFYATFDVDSLCSYIPEDIAILLPASSFARKNFPRPALPAHIQKRGADSGGFVASRVWGDYRYSLDTYVSWLRLWSPQWAATMDYCCEPELSVVTQERQRRTTQNAWTAWSVYSSVPWAWVPTVQGWLPEDYRRHAVELKPLLEEMRYAYAANPAWRVGVGTLCRRDDVVMVQAILDAVRSVLPGFPLHLWGIKLDALRSVNLAQVISTDSAAWHGKFAHEIEHIRLQAAQAQMSIRRYSITVKLPRYLEKVVAAVAESVHVVASQRDIEALDGLRALLRSSGGWTLDLSTRRNRRYAYAVRRVGSRRERYYLGPVSDLTTCRAAFLARIAAEQSSLPRACSLWNTQESEVSL